MPTFLNALRAGRVLLMDGAMGTMLQRAGLKPHENAALWNVRYPERVYAVHRAYRKAGAKVLLTNTFQANPSALPQLDPRRLSTLCLIGARQATGQTDCILADIGPIVAPGSNQEFADPAMIDSLAHFTALMDGILLETCSSPRVRFVVRRAARNAENTPVLLSLTYLRNPGHKLVTFSGHTPEWFAERAAKWGVAALGVNCGRDITIADCAAIIRRYRQVTDLPLFARPNAGTPKQVRGRWVYPLTPRQMAEQIPELLETGVSMIGGCCGTTPQHIAALKPLVDRWNARRHRTGNTLGDPLQH